jgi:hypothetical protein
MRRFLHGFAGQEHEVALEATTGWRLVVEELERVGARGTWPSRRGGAGGPVPACGPSGPPAA